MSSRAHNIPFFMRNACASPKPLRACAASAPVFRLRKSFYVFTFFLSLLCGTGTGRNYLLDDDIENSWLIRTQLANGENVDVRANIAFMKMKKKLKLLWAPP